MIKNMIKNMIKICSIAFLSLLLSASSLFAQTKTFAGADYSQGIVFVMENNQMEAQSARF